MLKKAPHLLKSLPTSIISIGLPMNWVSWPWDFQETWSINWLEPVYVSGSHRLSGEVHDSNLQFFRCFDSVSRCGFDWRESFIVVPETVRLICFSTPPAVRSISYWFSSWYTKSVYEVLLYHYERELWMRGNDGECPFSFTLFYLQ